MAQTPTSRDSSDATQGSALSKAMLTDPASSPGGQKVDLEAIKERYAARFGWAGDSVEEELDAIGELIAEIERLRALVASSSVPQGEAPWTLGTALSDECSRVRTEEPAKVDGSLYHCPCCFKPALQARGDYEICRFCNWEDDGQDDRDADEHLPFSPNHGESLTEARIRIAASRSASSTEGWRPIETAPSKGKHILVWTPGNLCTALVARWTPNDPWTHASGRGELIETPTHWQPLPAPPASLAGGDAQKDEKQSTKI